MNTHTESNMKTSVLDLTGKIVTVFLDHNTISADAVPGLIESVHTKLVKLHGPSVSAAPAPAPAPVNQRTTPAVPIANSVTPEYIICLEDGQKFQMLKSHLRTAYNMTPEQYREKWNLPAEYPMVAPNYAAARSLFAKKIGLGKKGFNGKKARQKPGPKPGAKAINKAK